MNEHLKQMLIDRGYTSFITKDDKIIVDSSIHVYNLTKMKIGIKHIQNIQQDLCSITHMILIYTENISSFAKNFILGMEQSGLTIELFKESEFYINITKHCLVPKHEKMTKEFKKAFLETYKIKDTNLPVLKKLDPVSKYYGFKINDLIKITRDSETACDSIIYRIVK